MLQLKNITKDYVTGDTIVHALKGVSIQFRECEFVSILGQSGCGKTTMLNIIGGLDQYSDGDLIIEGKSTKDFKDRDWDAYRNNSIGFVFQSYNLIPHQTVLQNVELALTLSGVSKSERKERAIKALEEVGLGDQLKKKPSEMSGGQMQRVAIARALVNNPDIILADEPTGALDSETSIQVMEILKKVAHDRLVIMVTHNPDLAQKYSTRIIKMLDGVVKDDSMPIGEDELKQLQDSEKERISANTGKKKNKEKKPSMSWGTSFGLSLKNLFTKKGRTILTVFAGSIGIIGIALIYAVSQGMTTYIDDVQEDTLSSYPLTIEATNIDISTLMETFMGITDENANSHENDAVYSQSMMFDMINALNNLETTENDLKSFKKYIDEKLDSDSDSDFFKALSGVQYTYDFDLLVYTKNVDGEIIRSDTQSVLMDAIYENMGMDMSSMLAYQDNSIFSMDSSAMSTFAMPGTSLNLWTEMLSGNDGELINPLIKEQYDMVYGSWPTAANEVVLVLNENNELDDLTLYALGLESKEDINNIFSAVLNQETIDTTVKSWSYSEICDMDFRVILNSDCYTYDEATGLYIDLRNTDTGLKYLYDNALTLKVTGIIRPNEDATSAMLNGSIAYTKLLTEYIIDKSDDSDAITAQQEDTTIDIFTGLPFKENTGNLSDEDKAAEFDSYIASLDDNGKANAYVKIMSIPSEEQLTASVQQIMGTMTIDDIKKTLTDTMASQLSLNESEMRSYLDSMSDEDITAIFEQMVTEQVTAQFAAEVEEQLSQLTDTQLAATFEQAIPAYTVEQKAAYYDDVLEFSDSTYEDNLTELGCVDIDDPASINLYASSFENKDVIENAIADYNKSVDELKQIQYTDYIGIMMSSITTIINAITYVLIAFVAISLIVSSIMIGVITLISVQERTKEIGILRAIGASKKNVSNMFNAETIMIGFASGLFGVVVTYILCIPINAVIQHLTTINNLKAFLPIPTAIILILISMILTLISGVIPSRSAAKKDPVVALRTE